MTSKVSLWRSLKTRIIVLMLVVFALGIWSLAFFVNRSLQTDMVRKLGEQQFSVVTTVANEVNSNLAERLQALASVAKLDADLLSNPAALQASLERHPVLLQQFNGGFFVAGPDGTAIADVPRSANRLGVNFMDRDYLVIPLKEGQSTISRPVVGKQTQTPVFAMAVPIRDAQGKVIGAIVGVTNLGQPNFLDELTRGSYGKMGGYVLVAPQHELIVTGSDATRIMQQLPPRGVNKMFDRFLLGYEGHGVAISSRGVEHIAAAKGVPVAGWFLALMMPTAEAFAPLHEQQQRLLWATLALTLVTGVMTWLVLRRQLAPVVQTAQAMAALADSTHVPHPLQGTQHGEIGLLVTGFNRILQTWTQRQADLQTSEQQYRSLIENLASGVVVHRADGSVSLANPMAALLLGLTQEQQEGKTALDPDWCFVQDDETLTPLQEHPVNRVLATGQPLQNHVLGVRHPGRTEPTWLIGNAFPMRDAQGKIFQVVVTFTDITSLKLAQAELHLAAGVFTHALEGIMITTADATIVDVNDAFTQITGYSHQEAVGQNPHMLHSGRHDRPFFAAMWRALAASGHWRGEIWNRRKDGVVFAMLMTISAVKDTQGNTQHYVALFSDITALKEHQSQLERMAHFDALTSLPNRVLLADRLQQAMRQAKRRQQQLAVAYLDLDGFKAINDHHGHEVGDQVLVALTHRMKEALRVGDTMARLGGDEFVAVLIDLDDASASFPLLQRLLGVAALPVQLGDLNLQVSASLGVTFYPQAQDIDADQLLRQADQAMYQAKVAGKNCYCVFDAAQDSHIREHHESLQRIRLALERREFVLHYQPKVNMQSGKVTGAEALIRWQHPDKGLLAPATFLPVIEDHPLAVEVGEWVIDAALHQVALWRAAGLDLPVSVNISGRQLQQADFVARLQAILARHPDVNPTSLELEVLETSALDDMDQVSQVIDACHAMGVKFALDDFGTGYSSLTYLKRLRVAMLKIDQSFVRDMLDDPNDLAILQGVIGLAAAFKREVIAEGVETVAHGTALLHLGCELAQGYGIARPMPADQLPAWAATWQPAPEWCVLPWLGGFDHG
ncbi:EAL domain-containing protein [Rhodoferax sp. U2-2l]|uniref:bifunctional diguanylate cyclase/phosphodiesterase n=1 Tax=Rhodoferax sp. U2-2l TaxID=2884000 RepID=UPI001D0A7A9C|nr:EAL domain-containing protein [Rhodoferax sp. U2-2l]MCB8748128.1 EAL domain-containing protein [Rhodoferax sp. U2-2l]